MGQIVGGAAKPKRCNLNKLSQLGTPAAGEYILVSSDNSMNAAGQGYFGSYIIGDGTTAATALPLHNMIEEGLLSCPAYIETEATLADIIINIEKRIAAIPPLITAVDEKASAKLGEDEELVIANALVDLKKNGSSASSQSTIKGSITLNNVDTITIIGASYSDGTAPIVGKDWTSILSGLTDYNYLDLAYSGTNPVWWLNQRIRKGMAKPPYCLITGYSVNQLSSTDAIRTTEIICDTLESYGIEPIIGSSYNGGSANDAWLRTFAKNRGYYYFPCGEYYALTYKGRNHSGDDGYHLGTYSIGAWSNGYMVQAPYIDRAMQSLKIFKLRSESTQKTLDELVFHTNEERYENFYELLFGQRNGGNQYSSLSSVEFSDKALVSCVLPATTDKLIKISLKVLSTDSVNVYALNTLAAPYPEVTTYARFSVAEEITLPSLGDVYSTNGVTYTVNNIVLGENGMFCTIYCSPTASSGEGGTLTKVSGSGPQTIVYTMIEQASLSSHDAVVNDNGGHWVKLTESDGLYTLHTFDGFVHIDKIHFLIEHNDTFNIQNVEIEYECVQLKTKKRGRTIKFDSNEYNSNEDLLSGTFGAIGSTLSDWIDGNGSEVVTNAGYVSNYIGSSVVTLSDTASMEKTISLTKGKYMLEIIARNPQTSVTGDSYDFTELFADLRVAENVTPDRISPWVISKKVGLYPTILRYPVEMAETKNFFIKLYSTAKSVEILKISLKRI